jgi:predicted dienelactone hydrolase
MVWHPFHLHTSLEGAAVLGAIDYKWTFAQRYASKEEREQAYSMCHNRSALRVRNALLANGGMGCSFRRKSTVIVQDRRIHKNGSTYGFFVRVTDGVDKYYETPARPVRTDTLRGNRKVNFARYGRIDTRNFRRV